MTEITDVKLSDIENTYQKINSYDNGYIYYEFRDSYVNVIDYFRRMRDSLSLGYTHQNNKIQNIDDSELYDIIHNAGNIPESTKKYLLSSLQSLGTHSIELNENLNRKYMFADIITISNDVTHSSDELNKLISEFNQRISDLTHSKIPSSSKENNYYLQSNLFPSIDDLIRKLQDEIKILLSRIEDNNKLLKVIVEINECMLSMLAVSALWLHNSQRFDIYFTPDANLSGLDTLVAEQKQYFTSFGR